MSSQKPPPFQFRRLPGEIRNKIYRYALCDFELPQPVVDIKELHAFGKLDRVHHTNDTAFLRINKKHTTKLTMSWSNRIVSSRSLSSSGVPLKLLLIWDRVPVVAQNPSIANSFTGFVLAVDIQSTTPPSVPREPISRARQAPCSLMILHRHLEVFCHALTRGNVRLPEFNCTLKLSIMVGPCLDDIRRREESSDLREFFSSEKTQKSLLGPLEHDLRGISSANLKISRYVDLGASQTLRLNIEAEMGESRRSCRKLPCYHTKGLGVLSTRRPHEGYGSMARSCCRDPLSPEINVLGRLGEHWG